jgi:HK97 family phage portal protein
MASFFSSMRTWWGSSATSNTTGSQNTAPVASLVPDTPVLGEDAVLQLSAVWACVDRRATAIASLPCFVYENKDGKRELARDNRLYTLLHDSPNSRMTPFDFWRTLVMNHDIRGCGYARIDRDSKGEAVAMWPMPASQVSASVLEDGSMVYEYRIGNDLMVLAESSVMVVKGLGNGTTGLDKLSFMRSSTNELAKAQEHAATVFGNGGKPAGVLMLDSVLKPDQRTAIQKTFDGMVSGKASKLYVLEADMKYQQLSMTPQDQQLLETRKFGIEEICRWFDVPPVLIHHSNVTTWGSGIYEIKDGFHTLAMRPLTINIEQAIRKHVMTPRQRAMLTAEFSYDAMLRGDPDKRSQIIARQVQNGLKTRNEARQLENDPPVAGGDVITVQSNLLPIEKLGLSVSSGGSGDSIAQ